MVYVIGNSNASLVPLKAIEHDIYGMMVKRPSETKSRAKTRRRESDYSHIRSQSMPDPESTQKVHLATKTGAHVHHPVHVEPVRHPGYIPFVPQRKSNSSSNALKRSHTNAADYISARNPGDLHKHDFRQFKPQAAMNYGRLLYMPAPTLYGSTQFLASSASIASLNWCDPYYNPPHEARLFHARSRSNIATLFSPPQINSRDFLSRRFLPAFPPPHEIPASNAMTKDLMEPLHVDCSVEYDLGIQPKIPKNSAPLLIIHPAFVPNKGFHSYSSSPGLQQDYSDNFQMRGSGDPQSSSSVPYLSSSSSLTSFHSINEIPSKPSSAKGIKQRNFSRQLDFGHSSEYISSSSSFGSSSSNTRQRQQQQSLGEQLQTFHLEETKTPFTLQVTGKLKEQRALNKQRAIHPNEKRVRKNHRLFQTGQGHGSSMSEVRQPRKNDLENGKHDRDDKDSIQCHYYDSMPDMYGQIIREGSKISPSKASRRRLELQRKLSADSGYTHSASSNATSLDQNNVNCDSGLGSPNSLVMESSPEKHNHHTERLNSSKKWRQSMSGLLFCCSSAGMKNVATSSPIAQVFEYHATSTPKRESVVSEAFPPSLSPINHDSSSHTVHTSDATSPEYSPMSSIYSLKNAKPRQRKSFYGVSCPICPNCSSEMDSDCLDGFCASIWNKENMSIQI